MKEIQISTFKAKCLQIIDEVNRTGKELKITRHGKPVAIIMPISEENKSKGFGLAKGTIEIKSDLVEPAFDPSDWEVLN